MMWSVGVVTSPRIVSTLDATLSSIADAGWPEAVVRSDRIQHGGTPFGNWISCLSICFTLASPDGLILICEDDVLLSKGLRNHLESHGMPDGILSLYTGYSNHGQREGWSRISKVPKDCHGALAYVIDHLTCERMLASQGYMANMSNGATDRAIGYFCKACDIPYMCHTPSFAYHLGEGLTTVGNECGIPGYRNCRQWIRSLDS